MLSFLSRRQRRPGRLAFFQLPVLLVTVALMLSACGGDDQRGTETTQTAATPKVLASVRTADAPPPAATMRVHYFRMDGAYTNWGVYSWQGPLHPSGGWPGNRFVFDTMDGDGWGIHVDIPMDTSQSAMSFLITLPNASNTDASKDCWHDQQTALNANLASQGQEIWIVSGDCTVYSSEPVKVNLQAARAVWLTPDTLVWPNANASNTYRLLAAPNAGMTVTNTGVDGANASFALTVSSNGFGGLPADIQAKYPQYAGATVLKLDAGVTPEMAKALLKGELAVIEYRDDLPVDGTQLQLAPVLDALYSGNARPARLGVDFDHNKPVFSVWAPTAQSVNLNVYDDANAATPSRTVTMKEDAASGVWRYAAPDASWTDKKYYSFAVTVYSRMAGSKVVTNNVADPYAVSLNAFDWTRLDNLHAMVLNLASGPAKPEGWDGHIRSQLLPAIDGTDSAIYELHVRDFSANDPSVAAINGGREVGTFEAFAPANIGVTQGMRHLAALSRAGLTHVHLLPPVQFGSVDAHCTTPAIPPSSGADLSAQSAVIASQNTDCFNWGYDPLFYGVPEGSYSTDRSDGSVRVREFRDMVMGLHQIGLRVVMDVVYNHTPASGQSSTSFLDRIVPGYYYRLDELGNVRGQSGAGSDLAAENAMTEKLVIDTLTRWADDYKVDGFRFDIMSLLPKQVLLDAQAALNKVALADGRRSSPGSPGVYLYGEGWTQSGLPFVNAQQNNMAGTGIGTFNDRLRDAVRGGGPFDSGEAMVQHQGFINGLCYDNNDGSDCDNQSANIQWCDYPAWLTQQQCLLLLQSRISVGLAGNLANFPLSPGKTGAQVDYFGGPTGYTETPQENVSYISVHDNETVFDVSQYKHPATVSGADRARAQVVGMSLVALSQGVPFFQAGDDLLRSKSMDSNGYNSGDYFNRIDWSGMSNNWAVGAPPQNTGNNAANLSTMTPLLNNPALAVSADDIRHTTLAFQDFLRIRRDTSMFRLKTAGAIERCVSFPDQSAQQPGLIVMRIAGDTGCGDSKYRSIVVLFNANKAAQSFSLPDYAQRRMQLHPAQSSGSDAIVKAAAFHAGTFSVPARTTAVFVE